jgi:hypothetical protein
MNSIFLPVELEGLGSCSALLEGTILGFFACESSPEFRVSVAFLGIILFELLILRSDLKDLVS